MQVARGLDLVHDGKRQVGHRDTGGCLERRRVHQLHARGHEQAARTAHHQQALEGWGISVVVSDDDRRALADGRLLPVLPGWKLPDMPIYAITPRRGEQPAKVRHAPRAGAAGGGF